MGSLVPSFSLSRLRAVFGASWNWTNRPAYQIKIRHQFELGGFDVEAGPSIDLDPMGLEWMRTLELSSRTTAIEYRMILFDDLDVILPGFPGSSPEMLKKCTETASAARICSVISLGTSSWSTRSRGLARRMAMSQQKAISATVTGDDQKVGFRAMPRSPCRSACRRPAA
jgi:hypothetical protein